MQSGARHPTLKPGATGPKCGEKWKWSHVRLCDRVDCSPPGSSVHGIFQATVLERVAVSFSGGSSWLRDGTQVSHTAGGCFIIWATWEASVWRVFLKYKNFKKIKLRLPLWVKPIFSFANGCKIHKMEGRFLQFSSPCRCWKKHWSRNILSVV